ncbi:MAG: hypothetical protein E6559_20290 [Pantoea sp.]|nr:hypothetical protein [Pantoea sp.]
MSGYITATIAFAASSPPAARYLRQNCARDRVRHGVCQHVGVLVTLGV